MIRNYLKTAFRTFQRNNGFSMLNILGLAIGIAASLLILQFVKYEQSFDRFHSNSENIYRIQYNNYQNNKQTFACAAAVPATGPAMVESLPEVKSFVRMMPMGGVITYLDPQRGEIAFREEKMQMTEQSVFEVFDFKIVRGDTESCLDGSDKIVMTESAAKRYFGEDDPIGKQLTFNGDRDLEVSAVIADLPDNSHIKFEFMLSNRIVNNWWGWDDWEDSWGWYDHNTYVVVDEGVDITELQSKWDNVLADLRIEDWEKYNNRQEFIFQPMVDIHLTSNLLQESEPEEQGNADSVYFLTIIAFFILIIAWVNYINLSTAKSMERANEVGVRKVMGAYKNQLMYQFLTESLIINLVATLIGVIIVIFAWPYFAELTGRNIPLSLITEPGFWITVTLLFLGGTALSGFYPAIVLSSFKPVTVLKGKLNKSSSGDKIRKGLVIFQFLASVVLIVGTVVVYQQIQYMKNQDLGVSINETLVIEGPGVRDSLFEQNRNGFKQEILGLAGIQAVTGSSNVPGNEIYWTRGIKRLTGGPESSLTVYNVGIDYDYIPNFGLEILAGKNFSEENAADNERVILNRSLAESLEFSILEDALGKRVNLGGDTMEIAGIIADYHQMSLKSNPVPMVFRLDNSDSFYAIKIETDNYQEIVSQVEESWAEFFPGNPFNYFFLDQFFNRQYKSDQQFGQVFGLFSVLAILVACLGLFGLASFMTSQRTKEIGIRKALGSSVSGIIGLLSNGFLRLVIISVLIAWPVSWFIMDNWLSSFPYRINVSPLVLILSGLLVILIAFLSVSYQTFKAARVNPADTLRYE